VTSALFDFGSFRRAGLQMRREPAGTAANDFKGSGAPWEKGRMES
jgi:hypothetical protein